MNLHSVLCPTDFSTYSDAAGKYASLLASESNAKLYLLHVIDESAAYCTEYTGMGYLADMTQRLEHECQELMDQVSPSVPGVPFERHILLGTPCQTIIDFADKVGVDLIVIGCHGRTGVSRLLMGSVAEAVVRGAKCPVLTVKHPPAVEGEGEIPVEQRVEEGQFI